MSPFQCYRNWRIRRLEARIAYLQKFCDSFHDRDGSVPYAVAYNHGLNEKRAKIAELRTKLYHLREF